MELPKSAIDQDHRLERQQDSTAEALCAHRWRWTLDETNPKRISVRAYARAVGRTDRTVAAQVKGYALFKSAAGARRTLNDCIERAHMGEETESIADALAKARGVGVQQIRKTRPTEIRRVRELARERAEAHGTTVEQEAPKIARMIVKTEQAESNTRDRHAAAHELHYLALERYLIAARQDLQRAQAIAGERITANEREMLRDTIDQLRKLLNLIDVRITGIKTLDWDKELEKIIGEAAI